jgi:hypothetical protein
MLDLPRDTAHWNCSKLGNRTKLADPTKGIAMTQEEIAARIAEGWQPARIAPIGNAILCNRRMSLSGQWQKNQGMLIYIRPSQEPANKCDGRTFSVHPSDWELLGITEAMQRANLVEVILCEHQIQTD